jgi:transposase-like protein
LRKAEKAAIVEESYTPGAVLSAIALGHGLHPNQLYMWRQELESTVVADASAATLEIAVCWTILRVRPAVDLASLGVSRGFLPSAAGSRCRNGWPDRGRCG